jgi:hypothetical protein
VLRYLPPVPPLVAQLTPYTLLRARSATPSVYPEGVRRVKGLARKGVSTKRVLGGKERRWTGVSEAAPYCV